MWSFGRADRLAFERRLLPGSIYIIENGKWKMENFGRADRSAFERRLLPGSININLVGNTWLINCKAVFTTAIVNYQLSIINCPLSIINYQLSIDTRHTPLQWYKHRYKHLISLYQTEAVYAIIKFKYI